MIDRIIRLRDLQERAYLRLSDEEIREMDNLSKEMKGIDRLGMLINYILMLRQEIKNLRKELEQEKCPHSVDVLGVCEWCGAGAQPEHVDKDRNET